MNSSSWKTALGNKWPLSRTIDIRFVRDLWVFAPKQKRSNNCLLISDKIEKNTLSTFLPTAVGDRNKDSRKEFVIFLSILQFNDKCLYMTNWHDFHQVPNHNWYVLSKNSWKCNHYSWFSGHNFNSNCLLRFFAIRFIRMRRSSIDQYDYYYQYKKRQRYTNFIITSISNTTIDTNVLCLTWEDVNYRTSFINEPDKRKDQQMNQLWFQKSHKRHKCHFWIVQADLCIA